MREKITGIWYDKSQTKIWSDINQKEKKIHDIVWYQY